MAQIAVLHRPGDIAVVTGAAIFAINNLQHVDLIASGLELEAEIGMADLATEADPVEPVGKDDRAHAGA